MMLSLLFSLLLFLFCGFSPDRCIASMKNNNSDATFQSLSIQSPFTSDNVSSAFFKFGMDLSEVVFKTKSRNILVPTLSIAMLLSTLTYGTRGRTREDLSKTLGIPVNNQNSTIINVAINEFIQSLDVNSIYLQLHIDKKVIVPNETTIKSGFLNKTQKTFQFIPKHLLRVHYNRQNVLFTNNASSAPSINSYISFKGYWSKTFDPTKTQEENKTVNTQNGIMNNKYVRIMHQNNLFRHGAIESHGFKFIELPYKLDNDMASMFILLPMASKNISTIEKNLSNLSYNDFHRNSRYGPVTLSMPEIQFTSKFSLNKRQTELSFHKIFEDTADFTGICDDVSLKVNQIDVVYTFHINARGTGFLNLQGAPEPSNIADSPDAESFDVREPFIAIIVVRKALLFTTIIRDIYSDRI